jgi:hypothetical protein
MAKIILVAVLFAAGSAWGQTSLVCDPAGDVQPGNSNGNGNGIASGPNFPGWLDIVQSEVSSAGPNGNDLAFTMTLREPIPDTPAWGSSDNGTEMILWGWRMIGDLADLTTVSNGCVLSNGHKEPAAYFLDLIWSREDSSFRARLLDDTSCTEVEVPYSFSLDRTAVTLTFSRDLFSNTALIANPDHFVYFATNIIWKSPNLGNDSADHVDNAPDQVNRQPFILAEWSATESRNYCY